MASCGTRTLPPPGRRSPQNAKEIIEPLFLWNRKEKKKRKVGWGDVECPFYFNFFFFFNCIFYFFGGGVIVWFFRKKEKN
jgi:hypothetical protein